MTAVVHPARFTPAILDVVAPVLDQWRLPVHDPFAGTGERLGALCDRLGLPFTGTEIEGEFIVDPRVAQGDSTDPAAYPTGHFAIVTSPTYGNGMNDHFHARDGSRRHTYRQALADTLGHDQELAPHNTGRYAIVRGGRQAADRYWHIHETCVAHWPPWAIVNISNFVNGGTVYPLVDRWTELLAAHGYAVVDRHEVATPRQRHGANGPIRCDAEVVLVATTGAPVPTATPLPKEGVMDRPARHEPLPRVADGFFEIGCTCGRFVTSHAKTSKVGQHWTQYRNHWASPTQPTRECPAPPSVEVQRLFR